MNKELKSLTWKYFWQQKTREIMLVISVIAFLIFIPYILGHNIGDGEDTNCGGEFIKMVFEDVPFTSQNYWALNECEVVEEWGEGIIYLLGVIVVIVLLLFILKLLYLLIKSWVYSNWRKAKRRANKELRNIKTKRKGGKK